MKSYIVSLDIVTKSHSLDELSNILGVSPDSDSYSIGEIRGKGLSAYTVWKTSSSLSETAPLEEHLKRIMFITSQIALFRPNVLPADCSAKLNIGVMFESAYCSITIPAFIGEWIKDNAIDIEISCYPSLG
jgi:hypothetical protein